MMFDSLQIPFYNQQQDYLEDKACDLIPRQSQQRNLRVISPHAVEGFRARNTADHLDNY